MERQFVGKFLGPILLPCIWFFTFLTVFHVGGCGGCGGGNSSSGTSCNGETGELVLLVKAVDANSNVVYPGQFPPPGTPASICVNRVKYVKNSSGYTLKFAGQPNDCNSSTVVLQNGANTTTAQMMQIFGNVAPTLPISITGCGSFGGNPPDQLSISIDVVTSTN